MFMEYNEFLMDCEFRKLSPKTIKSYRNMTKAFLVYARDELKVNDVDEIKKNHVQSYLKVKIDKGCKEKYINSIIKILRAYFEYLMEEEYINKNLMARVKFVKEEKRIIEIFKDDEVKGLLNAYNEIDYLSIRNKTILMIQLDTGIRCTETLLIEPDDVLDDRILIHGKGNKQRLVSISAPLKKQLRIYKKSREIFIKNRDSYDKNLFLSFTGRILTVEAIERMYKQAQLRANITRNVRVSPHTSRHTYAVKMLLNNDIYTVSKLLGHSSVKITETYLQSLTNEKLLDNATIISPITQMNRKKRTKLA